MSDVHVAVSGWIKNKSEPRAIEIFPEFDCIVGNHFFFK
jgi:hypothetical protein